MENSWEKHWGMGYDEKSKRDFLFPIFKELESKGEIGEVVLDVGSGSRSVAEYLPGTHKLISLDIAGEERQTEARKHIKFDLESVEDESRFSYKKALIKAARFLDIDLRQEANREQVDSMIFSEILNYVDYKTILQTLASYLKSGGRFIIINMPARGLNNLFSEKGLKHNTELYSFLEQEGFEIEHKSFPWRWKESKEEDQELIILVARKKTQEEFGVKEQNQL